jgi:hypothetical protein
MKTGDSILVHNPFNWCKPVTYLSWLIRKLTGAYYNHAAILVQAADKFYVVEAIFPRVIITEFEIWKAKDDERKYEIVEIDGKFTESELTYRIITTICKKYDTASLFNLLYYMIKGKWKGRTGNHASKKLYCYELVAYVHGVDEYWKILPIK